MTLTTKTFAYAKDQQPDVLDHEQRSTVVAVLSEWFRLWAPASFIDGENIAEGGIWVGQSRHTEMDLVACDLLRAESSSGMYVVVGAFLDGYWSCRPVSDSFDVGGYAATLGVFPPTDKAYAATALALYSALTSSLSRLTSAQQSLIRARLLTARGKLLSRDTFPNVLMSLNYLVGPGQSRPIVDTESYRAYRCEEGDVTYLAIERGTDGTDVIHVHAVELDERKLEVCYEMRDARHMDADAPALIAACILSVLLEDRFRGHADSVEYVNIKTRATLTLPYEAT
jgi:hypothetical protein